MTGKSTVQPNPHILKMQVRSQDFHWGANFKNWDQFFWLLEWQVMQVPKTQDF